MYKFALLGLLSAGGILLSAESKVPQTFQVRLDALLTSYSSPPGTAFTARVISPLEVGGHSIIPQGSVVRGTVRRASAVGYGLVHERATLDLDFHEYELAGGDRHPLGARVESIENAREEVDSRGRIKGVLAASSPQGLFKGIWYRPSANFFHRSALGITGLGGSLWSRFSLGPAGAIAMLAARYLAFPLPEPEIQLPSGTELGLLATSFSADAPTTPVPLDLAVGETLALWLHTHPRAVTKPDGTVAADTINLAFMGSVEELQNAFAAAGWVAAESLSVRTFSTAYRAYNTMIGYSTAPVSMLLHQRVEPVVVFQKSFNTLAKRHHIRIWRAGLFEGIEVWLGAATHDAGISFQPSAMKISHKIDPRTDRERRKVITDLSFAACSESVSFLDEQRNTKPARNPGIQSNGRMAVIRLQPCAARPTDYDPADDDPLASPGSKAKRLVRRFLLETRQYFLRDNMYYWAYRAALLTRKGTSRDQSLPE